MKAGAFKKFRWALAWVMPGCLCGFFSVFLWPLRPLAFWNKETLKTGSYSLILFESRAGLGLSVWPHRPSFFARSLTREDDPQTGGGAFHG